MSVRTWGSHPRLATKCSYSQNVNTFCGYIQCMSWERYQSKQSVLGVQGESHSAYVRCNLWYGRWAWVALNSVRSATFEHIQSYCWGQNQSRQNQCRKLPEKYFSVCEFRIIFIEKIIRRVINIVGVKNRHDEVNIQISVKLSMNVFTKSNSVKKSLRRTLWWNLALISVDSSKLNTHSPRTRS